MTILHINSHLTKNGGIYFIFLELTRLLLIFTNMWEAWTLILNYIEKFSNKGSKLLNSHYPKVDVCSWVYSNLPEHFFPHT